MMILEILEKLLDAPLSSVVPFDFSGPSPDLGIGDEVFLAVQSCPEPGNVFAGGEEFWAGKHKLAFAWAFSGQTEAVPQLQFSFEEVGLQPMEGLVIQLAVHERFRGRPGNPVT